MKELKDFPGYFITEDGRVYSAWKRKGLGGRNGSKSYLDYTDLTELKPSFTFDGYLRISINKGLKRMTLRVHRLVADTYIPNPNNLPQVNHIDENKQNNHVSNLEWVTNRQNCEHSKCRYKWTIKNLVTDEIIEVKNLSEYAKLNELDSGHLIKTLSGIYSQHKNFKIISKTKFK
jgi:hypothetical protein